MGIIIGTCVPDPEPDASAYGAQHMRRPPRRILYGNVKSIFCRQLLLLFFLMTLFCHLRKGTNRKGGINLCRIWGIVHNVFMYVCNISKMNNLS